MDRLGIRQLRNASATAVRRAGAGERIVITVDGRPVAQLGPLDPGHGTPTLDDLAARGLLVPARLDDRPAPTVAVTVRVGTRLDRVLAEIRGR
jgi:prevent-host-death family protein